jgi:hypothetical protein
MLKHDARTLAAVILRSLSTSMVQLGAQLPTTMLQQIEEK